MGGAGGQVLRDNKLKLSSRESDLTSLESKVQACEDLHSDVLAMSSLQVQADELEAKLTDLREHCEDALEGVR